MSLVEKSGENYESGNMAVIYKARWSNLPANAQTLKKNKHYKNAVLKVHETEGVIKAEVAPYYSNSSRLWSNTVLRRGKSSVTSLKEYGDLMMNKFANHFQLQPKNI